MVSECRSLYRVTDSKFRQQIGMSFQDPIADMLTRVRNGYSAGKESVQMPHSNQKQALAGILKQQGYINDFNAEVQEG